MTNIISSWDNNEDATLLLHSYFSVSDSNQFLTDLLYSSHYTWLSFLLQDGIADDKIGCHLN